MRGRYAAACAAVLVGLAPPCSLAATAWAPAAGWATALEATARHARSVAPSVPALCEGAELAPAAFAAFAVKAG
jgi:hypothetical protein